MTTLSISESKNRLNDAPAIEIKPVTPAIGAEIFGIDLSQPLSDRMFKEVHDALMTHQVVFFHDQQLTNENFVAFTQLFGELHVAAEASFGTLGDYPAIDVLDFGGGKQPYNTKEMWHSDNSGREVPSMGAALYAIKVPSSGGDTIWASMYAAYDALSEPNEEISRWYESGALCHEVFWRRYSPKSLEG